MSGQTTSLSEQDVARFVEYIELALKASQEAGEVVSRVMGHEGPDFEAYLNADMTAGVVLDELRDRLTKGKWWVESSCHEAYGPSGCPHLPVHQGAAS